MICFSEVSKSYVTGKGKNLSEIKANQSLSFQCEAGTITGLLGVNGAGKSTALKMLAGLMPVDQGSISVANLNLASHKQAALNKMGVFLDSSGLYPKLTCRENIELFAGLQGVDYPKQATETWLTTLDLQDIADRKVEGFSTGQRMKTALARAVVHQPDYLILDEPTRGLDVITIRVLRRALEMLKQSGCCILFSSHVMQEVEKLCDHLIIIHDGKIVAEGTVAGIKQRAQQDDLEDAFMGLVGLQNETSAA